MNPFKLKYILSVGAVALCVIMVFGFSPSTALAYTYQQDIKTPDTARIDSLFLNNDPTTDFGTDFPFLDEIFRVSQDDTIPSITPLPADSAFLEQDRQDTAPRKPFLEEMIMGTNRDSLVYDVRNKMVYIYEEGDVTYEDMNLKADYMQINLETKLIYAYGTPDSSGVATRPEFTQDGSLYSMDTINYNMDSKKAKIKGVATKEGDGYLIAQDIKKEPDNTSNVLHGKYTTCDHIDHPHFYLAMTKAKIIPGKKVIVGPSYFVMEDVPIYFPLLPFGFFPITSGRSSGIITPTFGEENRRGFFLRDAGYYIAVNDYLDITLLGSIYSLGSWDASLRSLYVKRYRFSGSIYTKYSKTVVGDKGSADYINSGNYVLRWEHRQDAKFRPNSTFSASVNFTTSGYNRYGSTTVQESMTTQTSSSIAYSKSWPGKPFSLSASFSHSQNSRDTTVSFTFPNVTFNVSKVFPFKRKNYYGKERFYERVSLNYTATMQNSVTSKERDLFTETMFKDMRNGINHTVPVSASWTLFDYINIGPTFNYNERWYFRKIDKEWDPDQKSVINSDTTYGFYRVWNYSISASATTKIYGMYQMKNQEGPLRAVRHVLTPRVSMSYAPDFSKQKYGYYKNIQTNENGTIGSYSPYDNSIYGVPGRGQSAMMSFGLEQNLEAKVRSQRDTSGVRKIRIIDNLSISSSYNFLADSLNLAPFVVNLRTTIYGNYQLNVNATFDPYQIDRNGNKINQFMVKKGKLARLTSASTSFSYSLNSSKKAGAINDINSHINNTYNDDFFNQTPLNEYDPAARRSMMAGEYYDFDIPWNLGFSYVINYSKPGHVKNITQTLSFHASVTLTEKWGISANSFGYDFKYKRMTPGYVTITRDLHCWEMDLKWVPMGYQKSWAFHIGVKSAVLRDLKYDKSSSQFDNLYD